MYININIDITPPLPDIHTSTDKYNIKDKINNENNISADSTIFIFNLDSTINTKYNDPDFMLYGIKATGETYNLPSINYYYNNKNVNNNNYEIINTSTTLTEDIKNMLTLVGYTDNITVPTNTLFYRYIKVYDFNKSVSSFIYYLYFYSDGAQINNYNKYINYNNALINVYIYPYVNEFVFNELAPVEYEPLQESTLNVKYENLNFDNIELSSYNNKLDFTYFKNDVSIPKLKLLSVYNKYIQRYKLVNGINLSLHELNIGNSNDSKYVGGNITTMQFKTDYNKKNKSYNNICESNSITYNNKLAYINTKNNNTTSNNSLNTYAIFNNNITYQYKLLENYTINVYIGIINENNLQVVNNYLRKILLLIDPFITNPDYVDTITITINNTFNNKNEFTFSSTNKIIIVKADEGKPFGDTNTYYIDRYKITYQNNYVILLNIAFYNEYNFYIRNTFSITNYNSLAYVNLTYLYNNFLMCPVITNTYNNDSLEIYNEFFNFNFYNTTYYSYIINYLPNVDTIDEVDTKGRGVSGGSKYIVNNFSSYISNVSNISNVEPSTIKNYNNNILTEKVNNFIIDVIITYLNYFNYTNNVYNVDSLLSLYYTFDNNIDTKLINYYNYNPDPDLELSTDNLPKGFYKVFYYTNKAPEYDFLVQSVENDELNNKVLENGIFGILKNNFCLFIKINTITKFYLAICNKNGEIYVQTTGIIKIIDLFNLENGSYIHGVPWSMNLIFNNYFDICTLTIIAEVFTYKNASNTLRIQNIDVSTYPFDNEIYNYDELCYGGGVMGCGGGLVNIQKYEERSVIIIFNVFIYLKQELYYNLINRSSANISKIEYINKLDRYFNIILNLLITGGSSNDDENIQKSIQITSTSFINVSNRSEFQSMRNTFKIFNEIEQSLLLLENQITNKNNLYITLLYLYSPNITYNYIITPENEEIINNNQFKISDQIDKTFIINAVNAITEPLLLTYIDLINQIFVNQNVSEISAIVSNGNEDENNAYQVYISSLLFTNNKVYVYDFITNITTLLLYGNESDIDIYNNKYIDLIKIVLTNDILE